MPIASQVRRANAPAIHRPASLTPSSWNAERRTIDVCWTTGARAANILALTGEIIEEELDTRTGAVRLDRLNNGAPVLADHANALNRQIGVVIPGSARIEGGRGYATLQLSDQPALAPIVADIAAGIIRNVSVGYHTHAWEVTANAAGGPDLWRAIDWEPMEISFVPIPVDAGAQVRSSPKLHPCVIRTTSRQESEMEDDDLDTIDGGDSAPTPTPPGDIGTRGVRGGQRPATIAQVRSYMAIADQTSYDLTPTERSNIILGGFERGLSMEQIRSSFMRAGAERQNELMSHRGSIWTGGVGHDTGTHDDPANHNRAIGDALYARLSGTAPADHARAYMNLSMVGLATDMLERRGMRGVRSMAPTEILNAAAWTSGYSQTRGFSGAGLGFHSTSDFPALLMGAGQRFLMDVFVAAGSAIKTVSRQRSANDFRAISGIEIGGFGKLERVPETGEIKHGSFKERKETYALSTFAKQFGLSRQAIINDDLGAFSDPLRTMARAAAETEASLFADLLNSNPIMGDGKGLFHADHANLAAGPAGGLPSVDTLSAGRMAMRRQKDLDGVTPIAAAPKFILTSEEHETRVEQLLTTVQATTTDGTNPFAGKLTPLVDPRLDRLPWYLFADPALAPVLEHAYLNGHAGPHVDQKEGWDVLGQQFRIYMDFGAGVIDHRGAHKNTGAAG